jgi:uncharacterized protein YndB with AHSA1/START domain
MTDVTSQSLRVTRRFEASPEAVFDAWLNPAVTARWLFTGPTSEAHTTELDVRVGGQWKITDRREGTDYVALGEYLEIDRPRRLVFSFAMPQFSPESCNVTVEVAAAGTGSLMTLTQEPTPAEAVKPTEDGWNGMFLGLDQILAAGA